MNNEHFNEDLATAKWMNALETDQLFDNRTLFQMINDILRIHQGDTRQPLDETVLYEKGTPRRLHLERILDKNTTNADPFNESHDLRIRLLQGERSVLEEFKILGGDRGRDRFTMWWRKDISIASGLLGYLVLNNETRLFLVNLEPEEIYQIATSIWDAHAHTLATYGKQGILGLPTASPINPQNLSTQ